LLSVPLVTALTTHHHYSPTGSLHHPHLPVQYCHYSNIPAHL